MRVGPGGAAAGLPRWTINSKRRANAGRHFLCRAPAEQRAALLDETFVPTERTLYELLNVDQTRHIDEIMEVSGLTSSEVLATLFDLELKGVVRQLPGKQFLKVLL